MATGRISVVAVLRDARSFDKLRSALLRARPMDDIGMILTPSRFLLRDAARAADRIRERPRAAADESQDAADEPVACAFSLDPRQTVAKQAVAEK